MFVRVVIDVEFFHMNGAFRTVLTVAVLVPIRHRTVTCIKTRKPFFYDATRAELQERCFTSACQPYDVIDGGV